MTLKQKLKTIEAAIAAENDAIAKARRQIRDLSLQRDEISREIEIHERDLKRKQDIAAGRKWKREHPEEFAAFMKMIRQRHNDFADAGAQHLAEMNVDSAKVFHFDDFSEVKNPLLAHVMAAAKIFPSVGQAKKNGWDKPLTEGEWTVTKKKIKIRVEK